MTIDRCGVINALDAHFTFLEEVEHEESLLRDFTWASDIADRSLALSLPCLA
jgi:hypothetical protein